MAWGTDHQLSLGTRYKEEDVRSFEIVDSRGKRFQLWVDPPRGNVVIVHAWDFQKHLSDFERPVAEIKYALDEAYARIRSWGYFGASGTA